MTELYLARHGETTWHAENRYAGESDVSLNDHGREQALRLGDWAVHAELDALICSPLRRTMETAQAVATATGLALETDTRLRELAFGRAEGLTTAEMRTIFPEDLEAFYRDPVAHHLPGGEDPRDALARARAAVDDLTGRFPDGRVLVVSHTTIIRLLLCDLLGIDISSYRRTFPSIHNAALAQLQLVNGRASLVQLNGHALPPSRRRPARRTSENEQSEPPAGGSSTSERCERHETTGAADRQSAPAAPDCGPVGLLAAGDHFMLPSLLRERVEALLGDRVRTRELMLPWPHEPFGPVGEVNEASGTEEQMIEALQGVSICVTEMGPLTERILRECPQLELFCVGRGGPINANLEAATEHGVAVTFTPGRNAAATAEHTVALILAAMRRIPELSAETAQGRWRGDYYAYENAGLELDRTRVGLVGFGAIGRRVARALRALGAEVVVHDPFVDADEIGQLATSVSLEDLLRTSRVVSLHARATAETHRMIGAAQLGMMPPGSVLVNCARGRLVDTDALCDALDSGRLGAAALDVYDPEPIPAGSRLLRTPHLTLTPHVAGASRQVAEKAADIIAAEVARHLAGLPLEHCANPEVLRRQVAHDVGSARKRS